MNSKILIFITRYLCYASNEAFADRIAASLQRSGYDVEICNIINNTLSETELTKYIGRKYLAVIDFNSTMPRAMVGDKRFLDLIDGPFIDYIVDHPLYHHPILSIPLHNFHVICVDENHKSYIENYYPGIKSVHFLPLYGSKALCNIDFSRKKNTVLFSGTYYDPVKYEKMIEDKTLEDKRIIYDLIDILKADSSILIEDAYKQIICNDERTSAISSSSATDINEDKDNEFVSRLNSLYPADIYVRAVNRKKVIDSFLDAGIDITILGNEWDYYNRKDELKIIEGLDYIKSLDVIASCQMLLNVLPGFRRGSHDRILTGMLNNVAVISDTNEYLDMIIGKDEMITYSIDNINIDNINNEAYRIKELISDFNYIEEIAFNGYMKAREEFSFETHGEELERIIIECSR